MKKLVLVAVLVATSLTAIGQNKWQQKKLDYFVDETVKEYNLDDAQKSDLIEARTEMVLGYSEVQKETKAGSLSEEDKKIRSKELADSFHNSLIKITGKTYKELKPFLQRMREELKNM